MLDSAHHSVEVEPLPDELTVNIDCCQAGVGGTDTWSPKARPSDAYRLLEKHYAYRFVVTSCRSENQAILTGRRIFRAE